MSQVSKENPELLETDLSPRTEKEVYRDWAMAILKWLKVKIHSPMGIFFISLWFTSIVIMGITNVLRGDSFFRGPAYWIGIFLTYGLNTGQDPTSRIIAKPVLNWIFAPMVALTLGVTLFILPDAGFFRNGAFPQEEKSFDKSYMFFNTDVWGSKLTNVNHPKWTQMYLWIVWMPIIIGTTIAALYSFIVFKKIQKREKVMPSPSKNLLYGFIAAIIVGISMSLMTGNIILNFGGILRSLFIERKNNHFIIYGLQYNSHGQYHPVAVAFIIFLMEFIPFFMVYGIYLFITKLDVLWAKRYALINKIVNRIKEERVMELLAESSAEEEQVETK